MTDGPAEATISALVALGLPERIAIPLQAVLGPAAADIVASDPWAVLSVISVQPERVDAYARSRLGSTARPDDQRRQVALLSWLLARAARDGHTVLPQPMADLALAGYGVDTKDATGAAVAQGQVAEVDWPGGGLALADLAIAEQAIANAVRPRLAWDAGADPVAGDGGRPGGLDLIVGPAGPARDAAVRSRVARAWADGMTVMLAAPTLGAAARLSDVASCPALPVSEAAAALTEASPPPGLLLVEDAHVIEVGTMALLLGVAPAVPTVVLAADPVALRSVDGPGDVVGDLAAWLRRRPEPPPDTRPPEPPPREAVAIIDGLVEAVGEGVLPQVDSPGKEVVVVPAGDASEAVHRTLQLVTDAIPRALGIPATDVMVLTPAVRGGAGAAMLNAALKSQLNPGRGSIAGFDVGDRVAFTAPAGRAVAGDVGVAVEARDAGPVIDIAGEMVAVPGRVTMPIQPAYALTIARGQAGRWPAVVVVLPGEAAGLLCRSLVRTAFSRAERHLSVVHAAGATLGRAVAHGYDRRRRTALGRLLEGQPLDAGHLDGAPSR
jgi:Helix-hairpin-helix containing domain/AAA domain